MAAFTFFLVADLGFVVLAATGMRIHKLPLKQNKKKKMMLLTLKRK